MSRNSVGTYSLPTGTTPVIAGTTVSSSNENSVRADLAAEVTNSLDRQGRGAMLAPLALSDGSSSLPGLTFGSETNTGLYRAGTGDIRVQVASTQVARFQTSGTTLGVTTTAALTSDAHTVNGNVTMAGSNPATTTGFSNTLTKLNTCKGWGKFTTDGAGNSTLVDGFNINSVTLNANGTDIAIAFAQSMADGNYAVVGVASQAGPKIFYMLSAAGGNFNCRVYSLAGAVVNPLTNACTVTFHVYGRQ
jgi:hypothetical protein